MPDPPPIKNFSFTPDDLRIVRALNHRLQSDYFAVLAHEAELAFDDHRARTNRSISTFHLQQHQQLLPPPNK